MEVNRIIHADVLTGLAQLPPDTFHCVITSPPYWRLRSYPNVAPTTWTDGQCVCLGAEVDPDSFVRHLVEVFAGVYRVLRSDGVLFVNLGETYASGKGTCKNPGGGENSIGKTTKAAGVHPLDRMNASDLEVMGLKGGDRCGIPERFALAMQAANWWYRDQIIWAKRSPMPSSQFGWRWVRCRVKAARSERAKNAGRDGDIVRQSAAVASRAQRESHDQSKGWEDCPGCKKCSATNGLILRKGRFRTTAAHEPVFMFTKCERYFCDDRASAEIGAGRAKFGNWPKGKMALNADRRDSSRQDMTICETRNPRSVWQLSNEPTKEKHFAAYPTALVKKCLEMATSKAGCCGECGSPYAPIVESERVPTRPALNPKEWKHDGLNGEGQRSELSPNRDPQRHIQVTRALGYLPTCQCNAESVPCRVLDPFLGSGTTARVAYHTGRDWVGIEGSADYIPIAGRRILEPLPNKKVKAKRRKIVKEQQILFAD